MDIEGGPRRYAPASTDPYGPYGSVRTDGSGTSIIEGARVCTGGEAVKRRSRAVTISAFVWRFSRALRLLLVFIAKQQAEGTFPAAGRQCLPFSWGIQWRWRGVLRPGHF